MDQRGHFRQLPAQTNSLSAISCPNQAECFAIGSVNAKPSIIGESDGMAWQVLNQPLLQSLTAVSCSSGMNCVVAGIASGGGATTLDTSNGGGSWGSPSSIPSGGVLSAVDCQPTSVCVAGGSNANATPYVIRSSDNGSAWTIGTTPSNAVNITGISCSNGSDCVAVGNSGNTGAGSTIMSTTSGGQSWTNNTSPVGTSHLVSASCPTTVICYVAGLNSVLVSTNAGFAWRGQGLPPQVKGLDGISCASTSNCTAVGIRHLRKSRIDRNDQRRSQLVHRTDPERGRPPHGGVVFESLGLSGGQRLRAGSEFTEHHRNDERRRLVDG